MTATNEQLLVGFIGLPKVRQGEIMGQFNWMAMPTIERIESLGDGQLTDLAETLGLNAQPDRVPDVQEPKVWQVTAETQAPATGVGRPDISDITCSVFNTPDGEKVPGKLLSIDEHGNLTKETRGAFSVLHGKTMKFATLFDLAEYIRGATNRMHLTAGVCDLERVIVVPDGAQANPDGSPSVMHRNNSTFHYPTSGAIMVVDSDNLELMSCDVAESLFKAVPALAKYARIEASSTGSNIFGRDGTEHRGLRGQHTIFHAADGSDVPRALDVLHKRCFIAGLGLPRLAADGTFLERSPVDRQLTIPVQPIYLHAALKGGLEQRKSVEVFPGIEVLDTHTTLPDLTDAEEQKYRIAVESLRKSLLGESQKTRRAYKKAKVEELVAAGMIEGDAEEAVECAIGKMHSLALDWPIFTSNGEETTVRNILSEGGGKWHLRTVRDPLEPDYGSDTVAKVFFNESTVVINSQAHGGRVFMLQTDRTSAEEDFVEPQLDVGHAGSSAEISLSGEELASRIANLKRRTNQDENAQAFALMYGGKLKFASDVGKWFGYTDGRWREDTLGKVKHLIRLMCRSVGGAKAKEMKHQNAVEAMCKVDPVFAVRASETFDRDNYLLNTSQGVVDLRTGEMLAHSSDLLLSKMTRVAPSVEGGERFLQFLDEITLSDKELIEFLQVSLGACLSGAVESHWLLFWIGIGRNGKNTLGDLVMWIMGDYAKKIPATSLMAKEHEGHPTEIADLMGCRLAVSSEIEQGAFWQEAKINELTGDTTISARFMRQDFFEFQRTHKHLIFGNNRPRLKTVTEALKARIKIVPFKASFIGREDPELPSKLQAEAGFVLSWLIEGHRKWLAAGRRLPKCAAVDAESSDYFDNQSVVEMWIAEHLLVVPDDGRGGRGWPKAKTLYDDYVKWKEERGEKAMSMTLWGEAMGKQFVKIKADGLRYRGCQLDPRRRVSVDFDEGVAEAK